MKKLKSCYQRCTTTKPLVYTFKIAGIFITLQIFNIINHVFSMNIKIDTKEKFTVITPEESHLSANMTEELSNLLLAYLQKDIPHIVLNTHIVKTADEIICDNLATIQQQFYENNCSFVISNLSVAIEKIFEQKELLDTMNITPSESEAWDIVQMEEVERELLRGEWD